MKNKKMFWFYTE